VSELSDIEIRRIREQAIRDLLRELTTLARDPERIGRRVLALEYRLNRAAKGELLLTFAKRLGVSSARASVAVSDAEATLFELRKVTPSGTAQVPKGNLSP
jgi:hypothetical protein